MQFSIMHAWGEGEDGTVDKLSELYDELGRVADAEHGDVAVINEENAWCISAHRTGSVFMSRLDPKTERVHLHGVAKSKVIELWLKLIEGDLEALLREPWLARDEG